MSIQRNSNMQFLTFSELPAELRLKIWSYALPGPRTIEIYPVLTNRKATTWKVVQCKCRTRCTRMPSIAHTNSESRAVFFEHFTTCFNTYISWKNDTLLIQRTSVMRSNLGINAGSKELHVLDRIVSEIPRSAELSSFAITTNRSWTRNGLPQFLLPQFTSRTLMSNEQMSESQLTPFSETGCEILVIAGYEQRHRGRRTDSAGLRLREFSKPLEDDDDIRNFEEKIQFVEANGTIKWWRDKWREEGKSGPPPFRMVKFEKNAPDCFKNEYQLSNLSRHSYSGFLC